LLAADSLDRHLADRRRAGGEQTDRQTLSKKVRRAGRQRILETGRWQVGVTQEMSRQTGRH
jgi:hypothetical protein